MNAIPNKKRPPLLTYLCIVSAFISLLWLVMLAVLVLYSFQGNVSAQLFPGLVIEYLGAGYLFLALFSGLTILGLAAVLLMWQMKKNGYYLYIAAKTAIYFIPVVIIGNNHLTFTGLILTSIGIIAYGVVFTSKNTEVKTK
jgi:hypothetical protein